MEKGNDLNSPANEGRLAICGLDMLPWFEFELQADDPFS